MDGFTRTMELTAVTDRETAEARRLFEKARDTGVILNASFDDSVWKLTDEVLDLAEQTNKAALNRYRECDVSGIWPTGYEEIRIIDTL